MTPVGLSCTSLPAGVTCAFSPPSVTPPANGPATSALTVSVGTATAVGAYTLSIVGTSGTTTHSAPLSLTVTAAGGGPQSAVFDATLKTPKCAFVGSSCEAGPSLLLGRDAKGPEPNQPNTISGACVDGSSGTFHVDESIDGLKISTVDGSPLTAGKTVRIDATVWAWTTPSDDHLDLYFAADALNPAWTFLTTLTPASAGAQVLSATYTLPAGALQAVRAQFRYRGSASACTAGGFNDRDDLVFAVQ
jgi:leucyl aminopeptidase